MRRLLPTLVLAALVATASRGQFPAPAEVLGFEPGEDFRLAPWSKLVEYFEKLDAASDRVTLLQPGKTTEGRPFLAAAISSEANLRRLPEIHEIQKRLHDPRR